MAQTSHYLNLYRRLRKMTFLLAACAILLSEGSLLNTSVAQFGREVAPNFDVSSLDGEYFSRFNMEGEQALLMFWAPWCGVCRSELPKLAQYYQSDMPSGLQVLAIGTSASYGEVKGYVNGSPEIFVFPTAYDDNKTIANDYGIRAFPTYVLLDRDGTILHIHRGSGLLRDQDFQDLTQ